MLWHPQFAWVDNIKDASTWINYWHEDYPKRVVQTMAAITDLHMRLRSQGLSPPYSKDLHRIHRQVFSEQSWSGAYRQVDVRVGRHRPPSHARVRGLIKTLSQQTTTVAELSDILQWYVDFETVHPYQDGNGRVGGIVVAAYSHIIHPERGWLAALQ